MNEVMQTCCPVCREQLRLMDQRGVGSLLCPLCRTVFHLRPGQAIRQLYLAVDVSTSARRHLARMQWKMVSLWSQTRREATIAVNTFLFHRDVIPFPCERLCPMQSGEMAVLPTLRDLRSHIGAGSAIVDSLYRLLCEAERHPAAARDLILLTDGHERKSRHHPEEVRRKIEQVGSNVNIRALLFTDDRIDRPLTKLMRLLRAPQIMWSVYPAAESASLWSADRNRCPEWVEEDRNSCFVKAKNWGGWGRTE